MTESEKKQNIIREGSHDFDGISEYDNDMPRWWINLFITTVLFSIGYLVYYYVPIFQGASIIDLYNKERAEVDGIQAESIAKAALVSVFDLAKDEKIIAAGKEIYDSSCLACHAAGGAGLVGPNLVDDYWIYGNTSADLVKIIQDGALAKGMPGWLDQLGTERIQHVAAYIVSIQGTKPVNAKEAQGKASQLVP